MTRLVELAPCRMAHASGALWLPGSQVALIADAHLGYGWAQRRRGELGPVRDDISGGKLQTLVDELGPVEVVFLGDVVHAPRPGRAERTLIERTLSDLAARVKVTVVRGNHDRAFARDFAVLAIPVAEEWSSEGIIAIHGDRPRDVSSACTIFGHLHPSVTIQDAAGASQRVPVFLAGANTIVLPAFSPFAGGFDLARPIPATIARMLPESMNAYAATGTRVVALGPVNNGRLELARGRRTGRPSEWRR